MRRIGLWSVIGALSLLGACKPHTEQSAGKGFVIEGQLENNYTGVLLGRVKDTSNAQGYRLDTLFIKEGKFSYRGESEAFEKRSFFTRDTNLRKTLERGYVPSKANELVFYAFPGAKIKGKGGITSFINVYPSGDKANDDLARLNQSIYPLIDSRAEKIKDKILSKDTDHVALLDKEIGQISLDIDSLKRLFLMENSNSVASLDLFLDMVARGELQGAEAIERFEQFDEELADKPFYQEAYRRIEGIKATKVGQKLPSIKTNSTLNGELFDIDQLKGKYLIVDFWGLWCGACMAELPELQEFYQKHRDQLDVVAINSGDNATKIASYLKSNPQYDWHQLLSTKGDDKDNFVNVFNVTAFPTKFIVDPSGVIIAKYVGTNPEMYKMLEMRFR